MWGALVLALAAFAVGLVALLSREATRRTGTNGVVVVNGVGLPDGTLICQAGETLPAGTGAVRVSLAGVVDLAPVGPRVEAVVYRGRRAVARGAVAGGWTGTPVTIPLTRPTEAADDVTVCVRPVGDQVGIVGGESPPGHPVATADGAALPGSFRIDYLAPEQQSWWSFATTAFERIGEAHGGRSATVIGVVLLGCLLASWVLAVLVAVRTIVRDRPDRRLRGLPATAWAVMAIASLNAVAWSVVTPPFYAPDEITHFAYVQTIGETGRPPVETVRPRYSPELHVAMRNTHADERIGQLRIAAWVPGSAERLERDQSRSLDRTGDGSAKASNPEPQLYYALAAIPYTLGKNASLLERLALVRLFGALLAAFTALFAFLFVRELLPGRPWAWSVGALVVAFAPMAGFVAGAANPDALLFPVSAALFYVIARAFRRGMSRSLAIWIGVVIAIGLVGKINFYGLVPGALLAVALAARATAGGWNRSVARLVGVVVVVGFMPFLLMHVLDALVWDRANILLKDTSAANADRGGMLDQLLYVWQVYLPPLPGQEAELRGVYIGYERWFKTFVGGFSGLIVHFPLWGYRGALAICVLLAALGVRFLAMHRAVVRRRAWEIAGYATMVGGLLLLIALVALRGWADGILAAAQGRYLLPLLALFAGFVALGVRGAGERWGRALGAVLVVVALAWGVFGQLIMIQHFYS